MFSFILKNINENVHVLEKKKTIREYILKYIFQTNQICSKCIILCLYDL